MVRADITTVIQCYDRLGQVDQQVAVLGRFLDDVLQSLRQGGVAQV